MNCPSAAREEHAHTHSHDHREGGRQNRMPEPMHPACLRLCHFLTQASLEPHIEIGRRLRRLPLVQQSHCRLHGFQLFRTATASGQMLSFVRAEVAEPSRHIRHPFTNFVAFHNFFPSHFTLRQCLFTQFSKQILLTVLAKSHKRGRAVTSWPTRSSSAHRQSACNPSAGTCA